MPQACGHDRKDSPSGTTVDVGGAADDREQLARARRRHVDLSGTRRASPSLWPRARTASGLCRRSTTDLAADHGDIAGLVDLAGLLWTAVRLLLSRRVLRRRPLPQLFLALALRLRSLWLLLKRDEFRLNRHRA